MKSSRPTAWCSGRGTCWCASARSASARSEGSDRAWLGGSQGHGAGSTADRPDRGPELLLAEERPCDGVGLKVLAGQGANLDAATANGRLVFGISAALAEFERELIVERTHAGLASARACGRNGGRPFKMTRIRRRLGRCPGVPSCRGAMHSVAGAARQRGRTRPVLGTNPKEPADHGHSTPGAQPARLRSSTSPAGPLRATRHAG